MGVSQWNPVTEKTEREEELQTIIFNAFVFCQALIVEFAGDFASTVGLNWQMWILCVCLGLLSMPFAAAVKLIPVPDEPFHTYLFFWRAQEHHIVLSEGGAITAVLVGQKGNDEGVQYPEGTKFLEAVIGGETVRVPMPTYPSPYPPPTEPFFSRLRYAFFPNTHAKAPSATRAAQVPKPGVAWSDKK